MTNHHLIGSANPGAVDGQQPTTSMGRSIRVAKTEIGGNRIAVIQVPSFAVFNPQEANRLVRDYSELLPDEKVVLIGITGATKTFFGEPVIVSQLRRRPFQSLHWSELSIN